MDQPLDLLTLVLLGVIVFATRHHLHDMKAEGAAKYRTDFALLEFVHGLFEGGDKFAGTGPAQAATLQGGAPVLGVGLRQLGKVFPCQDALS